MNKKMLSAVAVLALLAMPVSQATAAPKPTPPTSNSGGQMNMTASQMASSQPAMSGWDMVKMRTTALMRAKAARNAKLKGKPAQAVAPRTFDPLLGPDYFGSTPNYASSPMPRLTWAVAVGSHAAGDLVIIPVYDPTTGTFTNPVDSKPVLLANTPFLVDPLATSKPLLDPINQIPQLDFAKVSIAGGIRKFVEPLTGVGAPNGTTTVQNAAGAAYIPFATPDTGKYPGSDYYEIGLKDYTQQFSPDLPPTTLRGYYQINGGADHATEQAPYYLGPIIVSQKDVPVRIKFINNLPNGAGGDLFIPVDTTAMGAGVGPDGTTAYSQARATLHLHGGLTPWISDGTPHQWTTPAGSTAKYPKGVSVTAVPDMEAIQTVNQDGTAKSAAASDGSLTFYYTNKQSARLMWYHDHAYGLTRLNVYAGEVAGYILQDPYEKNLTATTKPNPAFSPFLADGTTANPAYVKGSPATLPITPVIPGGEGIPLIIQDKAFVPDDIPSGYFPNGQLSDQDPTWNRAKWSHNSPAAGGASDGSLWFPHVYMPNQNPYDDSGANAMGRWDYGPWFWPIFGTAAGLVHGEVANPYATAAATWEPPFIPGTPSTYTASNRVPASAHSASDVSLVPEAFVDTPVVNGVAYPYLDVKPQAYRFRILDGANDRYWNLQMYCSAADKPSTSGMYTATSPAAAKYALPMWADAAGNFDPSQRVPANPAAGEVPMVPAIRTAGFPAEWPTDGRDGGVPDFGASAGNFLQIGTESGVLANAVTVPNQPVDYVYNRRDIIVLSIDTHALLLGPAERADVVFDFSKVPVGCKNVILYNDAPTPVPAFDPRNDYYTNNPDQTDTGGTPTTLPGYGPNTRTLMQFRISGTADAGLATWTNGPLKAAVPAWFATTQHKPIVPETRYAAAYPGDPIGASDVYSRIQSNSLQFRATAFGDVQSLDLTNAGSGYAPIATVTPAPAGGTTAVLVPVLDAAGSVIRVTIVNGGSGYTARPGITISMPLPNLPLFPNPTQARARATLTNGVVTAVAVQDQGSGYTAGATVTIPAPAAGKQATGTATVNMNTGALSAVTTTDSGNGYAPGTPPVPVISAPLYTNAAVPGTPGGVPVAGVQATATSTVGANPAGTLLNVKMEPKAIQELFEMDYGRMNATLGVELPFTNAGNQTTLPMGYTEPTTEFMRPTDMESAAQIGTARDGTEIWKLTHNGVDTHTIHFHLSDVQLINRVGWDGAIRPPDDNEMGWKESVRMNPLEDAIVAMRPATPELPFKIGDSVRSIDPTMPADHTMTTLDPLTGLAVTFPNKPVNFGWEYVWHCHLLGHEENDMMRPVNFAGSPDAATIGTATPGPNGGFSATMTVNWKNNANWQLTNFVVQRATNSAFTAGLVQTPSDKTDGAGVAPFGPAIGKTTTFVDNFTDVATQSDKTFYYRVRAESANGYSQWSAAVSAQSPTFVAPPSPPSAPVLGAVTSTNAGASVVVATASVLNGGTFTKYQYSLNGGTWNDFVPSATSRTASPLVVAGLTNNTTYSLTVRGVSSAGNGLASNAVTLTPSLAPTNVTVSTSLANNGTNARILVGWTGYRTSGIPGISYQVQVTNTVTNAVQTVPSLGVNSTTYTQQLTNGTTTNGVAVVLARKGSYSVQVRAMLNAVPSPWVTAAPATITMG